MEWINKILEFFQAEMFLVIGGAVYLLVEYFLGRTELVKAGSTLELVLNWIKKILELLKIKKPEGSNLK
jgi:hypothetical protein